MSYATWLCNLQHLLLRLDQGCKPPPGKLYSSHKFFEEEVWVNGWTQVKASSDCWGWPQGCERVMAHMPNHTSPRVICWRSVCQPCVAAWLVAPLQQSRRAKHGWWLQFLGGLEAGVCLRRSLLPEEQVSPQNYLGGGSTSGKNNLLPFLQINLRY